MPFRFEALLLPKSCLAPTGLAPTGLPTGLKVIGHFGVGGDPNLALFAERADQGEEMMAVLVGSKYGLFVIAALGEMQPVTGWREAKSAWQFALRR